MTQLEELPEAIQQDHFESNENVLDEIRTRVNDLCKFKNEILNEWADKYGVLDDSTNEFWMKADTIHSVISESHKLNQSKNVLIQSKFADTICVFKKYESFFTHASALDKADFCYQYGKALNAIDSDLYTGGDLEDSADINSDLTCQAIQWLTKALKFNSQHLEAWCELGDACWRQGDPVQAAEHFRQALKIDPKHVKSLCHLSMVIRQLPNTATTNGNNDKSTNGNIDNSSPVMNSSVFNQSVDLAHTAVSQQPTNGHAWSVLGNALLTLYFKSFSSFYAASSPASCQFSTSNEQIVRCQKSSDALNKSPVTSSQLLMNRCLAAYAQAVKDRLTALEPNFHYNRGLAWHYQDVFGHTLKCWLKAVCLDPDWSAPLIGIKRIIKFVMEWYKLMQQLIDKNNSTDIKSNQEDQSSRQCNDRRKQIDEFISPLSPLKTLSSIDLGKNTMNSDSSINVSYVVDQPNSNQNISLNSKDITALNRLLGPYCPSFNNKTTDNNRNNHAEYLIGTNIMKKGVGSSKKKKNFKASKHSNSNNLTNSRDNDNNLLNSLANSQRLRFILFNNLQIGLNKNTVCVGRVFAELPTDSDLTLNLLLVDPYGTPFAVRFYNIGKGVGPTRNDIVAIPHPFVEEILIEGIVLHACLNTLSILDNKYLSDMITKFSYLRTISHHTTDVDGAATSTTTKSEINSSNSSNCTESQSVIHLPDQLVDLHMRIIRVPLPNFLIVNGQLVGSSWTAVPVLKNIFFT
ncbi:Tetratricopeptide repeat protein 5 [Schistosoma japonicum]|nr:Tetratricopeptide repeat protein 5 [Schistosoma japonicum]KAH8857993.1 Tetratricopeptide repeat protein 5 [Schistosoma japonicum]KAH8857997.1 Tetratricopeptide repeat protein 5 [Schistosoma japonicum]